MDITQKEFFEAIAENGAIQSHLREIEKGFLRVAKKAKRSYDLEEEEEEEEEK